MHACTGSVLGSGRGRPASPRPSTSDPYSVPIAVDGCAMACARRSLDARGLTPLSVTLEELGVSPSEPIGPEGIATVRAEIAERLKSRRPPRNGASRPARSATGPRVTGSTRHGHSIDDYLHAIHLLTSPVAACGSLVADWPTASARVARSLSVTRATAGEALARLEAAGLIARGPAKQVLLTDEGRAAAEAVIHRHRLVERFLIDRLGCTPAESYALALDVRDALPPAIVERLELLSAEDARCPHGWPLDPTRDRDFAAALVAASTLPPGSNGRVAALVEHDADVLARLFAHGAEPGATIEVTARAPGGTTVVLAGEAQLFKPDEAAALLVALG